jgi:molecular chaperone DnaK
MLQQESGVTPDSSLAADEAVAHGAAIYAGYLLSNKKTAVRPGGVGTITNVNSHDLGVLAFEAATGRPRRQILIRRNTPLPARRSAKFVTRQAGQITVDVNVVEGGDDSGHNATHVGICSVTGLPPGLPARTPVDVEFQYGENGRLHVIARLPQLGRAASLELQREASLSDEQIHDWQARIESGQIVTDLAQHAAANLTPPPVVDADASIALDFEDVEIALEAETDSRRSTGSKGQTGDDRPAADFDPDLDSFLKGLQQGP